MRALATAEPAACPFNIGDKVTWDRTAPDYWRWIWTPGPMVVVDAYWHDGTPSEFLMQFMEKFPSDRPARIPGWIVVIEYDADSTTYYNPPLSLLLGKKRIQKEVHEKWLVLFVQS